MNASSMIHRRKSGSPDREGKVPQAPEIQRRRGIHLPPRISLG